MSADEPDAAKPKPYRMNALTGIGILLLVVGFLPVIGGDGTVAPFPMLIGALLLIGGVLQHALRR